MLDNDIKQVALVQQWQINKFLWICLLFIALFLPVARKHGIISVSLPVAYAILCVAIANAGLRTYFGWRSGGFNTDRMSWLFTTVDVVLISVGVKLTGELNSELWLIYYVLIISESMFATPRQTNALISGIVAGYLAATWRFHTSPDYPVTVGTRLFFLIIVGMFARRMSANREHKNQEVMRLHEQVAASDERARIAREIHDSLGHALVASILRLELCRRLIDKKPDEAEQILRDEVPALRAAWNEGRDLAFHLRPWERDAAGLAQTLRRHVGRFSERTGLAADLDLVEGTLGLSQEAELAITRIVQEALTNVAKHAEASRVSIRLMPIGRQVTCSIEDDGKGFELEPCAGSFGLSAMRERAEKLGGSLEIRTRPGDGTNIEVELPAR